MLRRTRLDDGGGWRGLYRDGGGFALLGLCFMLGSF